MNEQKAQFTEEQIKEVVVERNVSRERAIEFLESQAWHANIEQGRQKAEADRATAAAKKKTPAPAAKP